MILPLLALALQTPLQYRWVYVMTNLQVAANADKVVALMERAGKAGYNGVVIADSKLQRLGQVPDYYFTNAKKVIEAAKKSRLDLIPCVFPVGYADAMLAHDVNLVEAIPAKNTVYTVHGNEANLDSHNLLTNGGFESATKGAFAGLSYQDGPGVSNLPDTSVFHEGKQSLVQQNFKQGSEVGNARAVWTLDVRPWTQYRLSVWTKSQDMTDLVQAIVLDEKGKDLVANNVSPNPDWTQLNFGFNTLGNKQVKLYLGVWGGTKGKVWWDDAKVEEVGLMNVVRRSQCPLTVKTEGGEALTEGVDFEAVRDPGLGQVPWPGEYDWNHAGPSIKLKKTLKEGQKLLVSFYHAKTAVGNQSSISLTEPKTREIIEDEAKRVAELFKPRGLFFSHDEIRIGGWTRGEKTPGEVLAENFRQCLNAERKVLPQGETYVWSDMFDPFHNAVDGYYLTNGTLAGSWKGLSKATIIVNWNAGNAAKSLGFFSDLGNRQILAGYYDSPVENIKPWLAEGRKVKGLAGVMYTTWVGNYSDLEAFAKAAF